MKSEERKEIVDATSVVVSRQDLPASSQIVFAQPSSVPQIEQDSFTSNSSRSGEMARRGELTQQQRRWRPPVHFSEN